MQQKVLCGGRGERRRGDGGVVDTFGVVDDDGVCCLIIGVFVLTFCCLFSICQFLL